MAHRLAWEIAMVRTKLPHQNSLQKMQLAFNAGPPVGAAPPSVAPTVVAALFAAGGAKCVGAFADVELKILRHKAHLYNVLRHPNGPRALLRFVEHALVARHRRVSAAAQQGEELAVLAS